MAHKKHTYLMFGERVSDATRKELRAQLKLEEIPSDFGPFNSGATHCELFPFLKDERTGTTQEDRDARLKQYRSKLRGTQVILVESTGEQPHVADSIERVRSATATLKRNGVANITVVMPNAAYDRQDRGFEEEGRLCSVNSEWLAHDLKSRGANQVVTCTPHSKGTMKYWEDALGKGNYHSIDTTQLFIDDLNAHYPEKNQLVIGAPDGADKPNDNGQNRARQLAAAFHGIDPEDADAHLFKIGKAHIAASDSKVTSFEGDVTGKDCVIVDDMADGGSTLINAAKEMKAHGARSVSAYITHAICSEKDLPRDETEQTLKLLGQKELLQQMIEETPAGDPALARLNTFQNNISAAYEIAIDKAQSQKALVRLMARDETGAPIIDRLVTTDTIPEIEEKRSQLPPEDQGRISILSVGKLLTETLSQLIDSPSTFSNRFGTDKNHTHTK